MQARRDTRLLTSMVLVIAAVFFIMSAPSATDNIDYDSFAEEAYQRDMNEQYDAKDDAGSFGDDKLVDGPPNDGKGDHGYESLAGRMDLDKDASMDETTASENAPTDEYFQYIDKTFKETLTTFNKTFSDLYGDFQTFHTVATQVTRNWEQVQANEHAEADRLDQVAPEIEGFTAQFDGAAGDDFMQN